jgi:hypothetical protein
MPHGAEELLKVENGETKRGMPSVDAVEATAAMATVWMSCNRV